jgi:hypothetical protein
MWHQPDWAPQTQLRGTCRPTRVPASSQARNTPSPFELKAMGAPHGDQGQRWDNRGASTWQAWSCST